MNHNATISPRDLNDLIWMSYRYCIGRSTIHAHAHATTIWRIITDNRDLLNADRAFWYAKDIRDCIAMQRRFHDNLIDTDLAPWEELADRLFDTFKPLNR